MKKQRFAPAVFVILIMVLLIVGYIAFMFLRNKPADDKICEGVYIETINVSGMTKEQAAEVLQQHVTKLSERTLEVDVNGKIVSTTMSDIGFGCDTNKIVEQAFALGKEGNVFANSAKVKELKKKPVTYALEFTYSEDALTKFVEKTCGKECVNAKNSKIKRENGSFVYTEAREGVAVDVAATIENIKTQLKEQEEATVVKTQAVVVIEQPKVTKELASRCKDKLGNFSTIYSSSNISRSKNVANAARLINGTVVYPGETFSVHDTISPLTEENGYYEAASYSNGQVVDSVGGGVCQVSTTLYNAVLRAELEIVERSPHSMVVSYVEPSMDAAIAGDYKDFKFKNNTDVPIYIEGAAYSGTIYFNIYGEETRSSDRSITFDAEILEVIKPGKDKVTKDKTKPEGYEEVTQEAHVGYKAVLWKIITENGKTEKVQINSSSYAAEPRYVIKGTAKATPTPKPTKKPVKKTPDEETDESTESESPQATATPEPAATVAPTEEPAATAEPGQE